MTERASLPGVEVGDLPTTVFGARDTAWWGTMFFAVIEGTTLFACLTSYFYLRHHAPQWPPARIAPPSLTWPTVHVIVMVLSNGLMLMVRQAAHGLDITRLRRWMMVATIVSVAFVAFRYADLTALNVRWDTHAYGSILWLTVGFHTTLLVANAVEMVVFTLLLHSDRRTERHFSDASDSAGYWVFMTMSWVVLYALLYVAPHLHT